MVCRTGNKSGVWSGALRRWRSALVAGTIVLGGCAAGPQLGPLTPQEIAQRGTVELTAPRDTVFNACVLALRMEGYAIDLAEPVTGLVVTMPKRLRGDPAETAEQPRYRGYVVRVQALPSGRARVVATPTPADTGAERTWDLDQERTAWARLFEDVRMLVARETEGRD